MAETKRPTSPAAEEILGLYFPVLDHGFVSLVDYMGTDESIERAARVSYGYGTRKANVTRGLLRYLRRHKHTTPSEMVELKFHCCMPIFIARQWIRHRTACLAGDARVSFDLPGPADGGRGERRHHTVSMADLHRRWHGATPEQAAAADGEAQVGRMQLRSCDEQTGEIIHTRLVDIWESGVKPVFRVTLQNGKSLKMSKDHRCLTERGWLTLEQATGLRVGSDGAVSWADDAPAFAVNGVPAHQDEAWLRARRAQGLDVDAIAARAGASRHTIRRSLRQHGLQLTTAERGQGSRRGARASRAVDDERRSGPAAKAAGAPARLVRTFSRVAAIELGGQEMTYDLEVAGPYHNFVADGFIVHNSVNEYSGRYSLVPMLFYTPDAAQLQTQSKKNNQGRSGTQVAGDVHAEAVRRWSEIRRASTDAYEWMTGGEIARELARIDLPLSTYTQWYWKIDLHNLLHFLTLRVDAHAQWEIQEFGRVMAGMLKRVAPLSYEAWIDYDVCGGHLSRMELDALRSLLAVEGEGLRATGGALTKEALAERGLSKREIDELLVKLAPPRGVPDFELDLTAAKPAEHYAARFADAVPKTDRPPPEG